MSTTSHDCVASSGTIDYSGEVVGVKGDVSILGDGLHNYSPARQPVEAMHFIGSRTISAFTTVVPAWPYC